MNLIVLVGRLTKDPDIRNTGTMTVARYTLAVDRRFKKEGQPQADFINLVSFGKTAEFVEKYVKKGTKLIVQGEIQNNNYEKDGKTVYSDQIIVNSVEFAESRSASKANEGNAEIGSKSLIVDALNNMPDFMDIPDGEDISLPF